MPSTKSRHGTDTKLNAPVAGEKGEIGFSPSTLRTWDLIRERERLNDLLMSVRRAKYTDDTMLEVEAHFEKEIKELDEQIDWY